MIRVVPKILEAL